MSSNHIALLKRKIQTSKSRRYSSDLSEDDIIRSRLLFEGDQGSDDRRISTLIKLFNTSFIDLSTSLDIEKLFSLLYSIEHSYRLLNSTLQMDENEQICYRKKLRNISKEINRLRFELDYSEKRLIKAKQKRLNLLEYDQRTDIINKLNTRKELRTQQMVTLERKRYFEHLQQTFEATYQQRLKQIAIYMRPIFELDHILQQDIHEDGQNDSSMEQQITSLKIKFERPRTYSDSSITSMDGDENILTIRSNKKLINNEPQPLFSNDLELYGTQLVNPLLLYT